MLRNKKEIINSFLISKVISYAKHLLRGFEKKAILKLFVTFCYEKYLFFGILST